MLEKFCNDKSVLKYLHATSPRDSTIHVLNLMNFHIVLTNNLIIDLQMIGYWGGGNYETWWKQPNSAHAHGPRALNSIWTNMYTQYYEKFQFVNTVLYLSYSYICLNLWLTICWFLLMLLNIWMYSLKGMDTTSLDFNFFKGRLQVFYHIFW